MSSVVDSMIKRHADIIADESEDLLRYALMLLAGRVATMPLADESERSLFGDEAPKDLTEIRRQDGGRLEKFKVPTISITLRMWSTRKATPKPRKGKKHSDEIVDEHIQRMRQANVSEDMTIGEFLRL